MNNNIQRPWTIANKDKRCIIGLMSVISVADPDILPFAIFLVAIPLIFELTETNELNINPDVLNSGRGKNGIPNVSMGKKSFPG